MSTVLAAPALARSAPAPQAAPATRDGPWFAARIPGLDGLRGLGCLTVVFVHNVVPVPDGADLSLPARLYLRSAPGLWWVLDLFFALSGFLITGILFDAKGKPHYFRNFYLRRALRIFPLYYGVLLVTLLVSLFVRPLHAPGSAGEAHSMLWLWCYASNIGMVLHNGFLNYSDWLQFNHFWSLAVEEHYYLLWPLVVYALGRRRLMAVCVGLIGLALALRIGLFFSGANYMSFLVLTPCRMDALGVGSLLALVVRGPRASSLLPVARWVAAGGGALLAVYLVFNWFPELGHSNPWFIFLQHPVGLTLLALFCGAVLVLAINARWDGPVDRVLNSAFLTGVGRLSYGVYVFHMVLALPFAVCACHVTNLLCLLSPWLPFLSPEYLYSPACHSLVRAVVCAVLSVALAWLVWHLYEKHFLALTKYLGG